MELSQEQRPGPRCPALGGFPGSVRALLSAGHWLHLWVTSPWAFELGSSGWGRGEGLPCTLQVAEHPWPLP